MRKEILLKKLDAYIDHMFNTDNLEACDLINIARAEISTSAEKAKADIDELNRKHALEIESAYDCAGRFRRRLLKAKADLQKKLKVAFVTGYELGHNDTVESQYTDAEDRYEDSKDDIIELIK